MDTQNRVALVTGCGKQDGIGAAIARRLAGDGHAVVVVDIEAGGARDTHEPDGLAKAEWRGVESLVEEIRTAGGTATSALGDISNREDVARIMADAAQAFGGVDILINNAGAPFSMGHGDIVDVDPVEFERVMAINVTGTFLMGQAVAARMREQRWGRIVNVASVAGRVGSKMNSAYSASKAGVIALAQTWALDLGADGVTANAVLPGLIHTSRTISGMSKKAGAPIDPAKLSKTVPGVPAGRAGTPEDVAGTVSFLASDSAAYVNGQSLIVDGGSLRL
ncbi:SDR family NAD(P)-dependent oxidoreductase [Sphingosinithalassobacter portus]|uniref:SDR family NAD(P)-dependent oxidoreductase n=1 Tax=Stakelama portus TaxID=2676234 RepID=UPI000D6DCC3E|nr:SDR family NAD(P)-dependent oxidoreductase [Sphingosinithalassobacter portus]